MIWLNLKTTTLRSPEYAGSEPVQRATWLNLLAYCCEQENGGKIDGCGEWKDRQWQQTLGVTLAEVREESALWSWDGDTLRVAFYPSDKQEEVRAKRDAGKRGGKRSAKARREAVREAQLEAELEAVVEPQLEAELQRKGKERKDKGKIKEGEDKDSLSRAREADGEDGEPAKPPKAVTLPTREEVLAFAHTAGVPADVAGVWFDETDARPFTPDGEWTDKGGRPIARWQSALKAYAAKWASNEAQRAARPVAGGARTKAPSVWELQQRIEAAQKEIDRISANPSNKEQVEGTFDRRLKPVHMAKVKALKARIVEMRGELAGVERREAA